MSVLEKFEKTELDFLVALPYRTGLWVSVCDDAGGHEADEAELQVLEGIIYGFATDFCKSEVTEALMKQTVARRDQWDGWAKNIENVPAECRRGVEILACHVDHKNVTAFKENLMEIAFAVAMAYREFDDDVPLVEKITMYWHFISDRVTAFFRHRAPKTHDEIFNISRAERLALTELSDALHRGEKEGQAVPDIYADENMDPVILEKIARRKEAEKAEKEAEERRDAASAAEEDESAADLRKATEDVAGKAVAALDEPPETGDQQKGKED